MERETLIYRSSTSQLALSQIVPNVDPQTSSGFHSRLSNKLRAMRVWVWVWVWGEGG